MHKSKGNAIWFDDAAEDDRRRRRCAGSSRRSTRAHNLNFGYDVADEVRRRFILPLWNSYAFFVTYARLDGFDPTDPANQVPLAERTLLDRWIISRLQPASSARCAHALDDYDPRPRRAGDRALRRRGAFELVHPAQPPPLLEERERPRTRPPPTRRSTSA